MAEVFSYLQMLDWTRNGGNFHISHSATQPLWQSGWVAEWLSGCSSHSGRVTEWLSGCSSHSGRMAEWLLQLHDIDSNLIHKHNPVNFNCHSYITSTDWLRTAACTLWTITWNHWKRKRVVMNPTSSGLETTITTTIGEQRMAMVCCNQSNIFQ